jgi:hypothetical protein
LLDPQVKRIHVPERVNAVVNRLNKTKQIRDVDHESDLVARLKEEGRIKRLEATERVRLPLSLQAAKGALTPAAHTLLAEKLGP